jgi:hypothetical protein
MYGQECLLQQLLCRLNANRSPFWCHCRCVCLYFTFEASIFAANLTVQVCTVVLEMQTARLSPSPPDGPPCLSPVSLSRRVRVLRAHLAHSGGNQEQRDNVFSPIQHWACCRQLHSRRSGDRLSCDWTKCYQMQPGSSSLGPGPSFLGPHEPLSATDPRRLAKDHTKNSRHYPLTRKHVACWASAGSRDIFTANDCCCLDSLALPA